MVRFQVKKWNVGFKNANHYVMRMQGQLSVKYAIEKGLETNTYAVR